jgi:hypothetical protein
MPSKKQPDIWHLHLQRPRDGCIVADFPENENEIARGPGYAILAPAKN